MAKKQTKKKDKTDEEQKKVYEGNLYDKIFKEDAEEIFLPLVEKTLGIKIKTFTPFKAEVC